MDNKNILISDANHGGITLIKEYSKYTNNNLFFYDTYDKLYSNTKKELTDQYGIIFLTSNEVTENKNKYTIINPIHMNPIFKSDYTHHEFTGYLINKHKKKYGWNFKIIEVTGVKGKTTTAKIIQEVLKDKNTLLLTSHNLSYNTPENTLILDESLSITPASIITALNMAKKENLLDKIDYCIFEVSLGITTNTDIGVLTNILENYSIANNTLTASVAKKSVFNAQKVICDKNAYDKYYNKIENKNIITVSLDNSNANLYASSINYNLKETEITGNYNNSTFTICCFALTDFYVNNILTATCVGLLLDISVDNISSHLSNLKTIKGRGSIKYMNNKIILEDINPGLNTTSIEKCINNLKKYSDNYLLIIGGDYGITCEEIDENKLTNYLRKIEENYILTGKVGYSLLKKLHKDIPYYNNVHKAFKYSLKTDYEIIQIIYRSEYNKCDEYLKL